MMTTGVFAIVVASYASLLLELTALHVPSVVSSLSLWSPTPSLVAMHSAKYRRLFLLSKPKKLLLFGPALVTVYAVFLYPLLGAWVRYDLIGDYLFAPTVATDTAGIGMIVLGRSIALASAIAIRRGNGQRGESFRLQTSGPFRWSRNPGLVGMYVFVAGLWLIVPSSTLLAGITGYVIYMDFKVRMEEDFLEHKFGALYAAYRLRTGRYLP